MDFQNRVGHRTGSGAPASAQDLALDRKERLRRLALESIDLSKDPYFMRNHVGQIECRICLSVHGNEAAYLSHTQGKKHQSNLARRAAKEKASLPIIPPIQPKVVIKQTIKIGRPSYRVTQVRHSETGQFGVFFDISYPESVGKPRHRFMSAFEQRAEALRDPSVQFLIFAAEPYENIGFRIPNTEIDKQKIETRWLEEPKSFWFQFFFRPHRPRPLPGAPNRPATYMPIGVRW